MIVVTSETMQELDRQAIMGCGISGLELMENAGRSCVETIATAFSEVSPRRALVVAGKGNNGGDGYVIARLLREQEWDVTVVVLAVREEISGDAAVNLSRLDPKMVYYCPRAEDLARCAANFPEAGIIVDAIFGTGLRSEVKGVHEQAIRLINSSQRPVLAVDIPSGINGTTGKVLGTAVSADVTVTFAFAKLGHVLYPGAEHAGMLRVADIGISHELTAGLPTYEFVDRDMASSLVRRRRRDAHKGLFGHCLIIAGSVGKTGAAAMAANSAVRAGAGLVTLAVPSSLHPILEIKTTEAMTFPLDDGGRGVIGAEAFAHIEAALAGKDSIAVGPGIGLTSHSVDIVRQLVRNVHLPMVIDADGLNALSEDTSVLLAKRSPTVILTPHPGEMARLAGKAVAEIESDRIGAASDFARSHGVFIVLKGACTVIASPTGEVAINGSGNPGMASGGMGDVLTGILVSLLGQNYSGFDCCKLGVFLHGLAGDLVASQKGEIGITAVDVQEMIPFSYKRLSEQMI